MRVFWSIIGLLVLLTVAVFLFPSGGTGQTGSSSTNTPPSRSAETLSGARESARPAPVREEPVVADAAPAPSRPETDPEPEAPAPAVAELDLDEALGLEPIADEEEEIAEAPVPSDLELIERLIRGPAREKAKEYSFVQNKFVGPPSGRTMAEVDGEESSLESVRALREARERHRQEKLAVESASTSASVGDTGEWEEVQVDDGLTLKRRVSDGAYLIGERFVVTGEGTESKPYEITWDMLYSVRETYRPRKGLEEIPAWTKWLDGSWVRVTGFMATAIFAEDVDELLIMKNEWDGCCIGIPPTPYDAVEVSLNKKIKLTAGMMTFGTITGKLEVEPYLVRNWLVGLYLLENGTVESSGF